MGLLFSPYLFFIFPFGAMGGLCFVIVPFPRYLHLYFCVLSCLVCSLGVIGELFSVRVAITGHVCTSFQQAAKSKCFQHS